MNKYVDLELTRGLAVEEIIQKPTSLNVDAVNMLKKARDDDPDYCPLLEIILGRRAIPYKSYLELLELEKASQITIDFSIRAKELDVLNENESSHHSKINAIAQVLCAIRNYYHVAKLSEVTIEIWEDFSSQVKNSDSSFRDQLSLTQINAIRLIAKVLTGITNVSAYSELIAKKKVHNYQHNKKHILVVFDKWGEFFQQWLAGLLLKSLKDRKSSFNKLQGYLATFKNASDPLVFLSQERTYTFWAYLKDNDSKGLRATALHMNDFVNWIIEGHLTVTDDSGSATIGYPLLTAKEVNFVLDSKDSLVSRPAESVKCAMPTKWLLLCKDILLENDYAWPKSLDYEKFDYFNKEIGKYEKVWCPVSTFLYLIMCELPLRRVQVKSLDSGEGDSDEYFLGDDSWSANSSVHAGYWRMRHENQTERGFIRKLHTQGKESVGFYVNTNKTQDRSTGFSDRSGYVIPWNNETILKIARDLRTWQEKYNPVDSPQKYRDIPIRIWSNDPSELVKNLIPDRFYLFRTPLHTNAGAPISEAHLNRFWLALMQELERRLNEQGDEISIITKRSKHSAPLISIFTPHGLRVAGLTAFVEAGVPIEVLSKVVAGHASILMTLYYVKFSPAKISEVLTNAQKQIEDSQQSNFSTWLKNAAWEDANKYSVYNDEISIKTIYDNNDNALWESKQIGICPNAGTRCEEGGELIRKNGKGKDSYLEVSGGRGNCVRCRFFISGRPWLIPLWLHGNKLLADSQKFSFEVEEARLELEALYQQRKKIVKEKGAAFIPAQQKSNIKAAEGLLDRKTAELDQKLCDAHATYRLIEGIRAGNASDDPNSNFPAQAELETNETGFIEQHHFRNQNMLVQASRLYPHIRDSDLERDRNHFIDKVMFQAGMTPLTFSRLSEDEIRAASDAFSSYLVSKLNDNELQMLETGAVSLNELGLKAGAEKTLALKERSIKIN
ncbi:VPA1269 family protein [Paraglaciecola mesophila]|uniref:VPA1269 family protein n=1 Tax=Paraglaciecola mesophila TaxID=197222 RepID=A0ABU9SWC2_9ALTE